MENITELSRKEVVSFSNVPKNEKKFELSANSNDNTFILYHLGISRDQYNAHVLNHPNNGYTKILRGPRLTVSKIDNPTAADFLHYLERVGGKYAWDRRKKYQTDNIENIGKRISDRNFEIFIFLVDGKEAGFCCTASLNKHKPINVKKSKCRAIEKVEALRIFADKHSLDYEQSEFVEIYKIGLFDEYTNNGYGNYFLGRIEQILLNDRGYEMIYLDTRDTNHSGVLGFYQKNNFDVFYQETLPSDLVPAIPEDQERISNQ